MIYELTLDEILASLKNNHFKSPLPCFEDRKKWHSIRDDIQVKKMLEECKIIVNEAIPMLIATEFMKFIKDGERQGYSGHYHKRRINLAYLTIGYCITENKDYLDAIHDYLWSICEETTWILSAHVEKGGYSTMLPSYDVHQIDLNSCLTSITLTETIYILDGVIEPEISIRVKDEIKKRIITPYYYRNNFNWIDSPGNWNSVCHTGIIGSAIYIIKDDNYLAALIFKALKHLKVFIDYYDEDGGTPEGINCWNLGFGHYLILSDLIERRTDNNLSLVKGYKTSQEILKFGHRIHMYDNKYVNFSDAECDNSRTPIINEYANKKLDMNLSSLPYYYFKEFTYIYRSIFANENQNIPAYKKESNFLFKGIQWMISRYDEKEDSLIFVCKGGNNGEEHNHNDAGTFIIHNKKEALIGELGRERFVRSMFTKDRYSFLATSSGGHSVPIINGNMQSFGKQYYADVIKHSSVENKDFIQYDLTKTYDKETGLKKLHRAFTFSRENDGIIEIEDIFELYNPGRYESIIWTSFDPVINDDEVIIEGNHSKLIINGFTSGFDVAKEYKIKAVRDENWYKIIFSKDNITKGKLKLIMTIKNNGIGFKEA